ncbi:MAG: hypothetical protein GY800_09040 [Planctomycetes bacterium]|nr:hypothetical protein [Planctomycetota bacterium]
MVDIMPGVHLRKLQLMDEDQKDVGVQHPLSTNGDSVYVKDIDVDNSDNGGFSGEVTNYFDSLKSVNSDASTSNPKSIKLWFNRTLYSHGIGFGCDDLAKGFGASITIKLLGSGEAVRYTKTFTAADPNSFLAEFGPKVFNGCILEFNSAAEVCLSNITIAKSIETKASLHGVDPNGDVREVTVTEGGSLAIEDNSSGLSIAEGKVPGKTFIHKFGSAPQFDKNDGFVTVWDGAEEGEPYEAMVPTYSTTDDIDYIVAENNGDTQAIEIQGLDIDWNIVVQTKTLTGQTPVELDTYLIRVFRVKNIGSVDFAGHVFCYVSAGTTVTGGVPQDGTKVRAVVHGDNNQTEMAMYTIPANKTGYMRDWYASTSGAKKDSSHVIKLFARPLGQVFQLKHKSSIVESGTSYIKHNYEEPEVFYEKTDIQIQTNTDQDNASVSAGFDIVLVDN